MTLECQTFKLPLSIGEYEKASYYGFYATVRAYNPEEVKIVETEMLHNDESIYQLFKLHYYIESMTPKMIKKMVPQSLTRLEETIRQMNLTTETTTKSLEKDIGFFTMLTVVENTAAVPDSFVKVQKDNGIKKMKQVNYDLTKKFTGTETCFVHKLIWLNIKLSFSNIITKTAIPIIRKINNAQMINALTSKEEWAKLSLEDLIAGNGVKAGLEMTNEPSGLDIDED